MSAWSLDLARKTYSIPHWSEGYFESARRPRQRTPSRRSGSRNHDGEAVDTALGKAPKDGAGEFTESGRPMRKLQAELAQAKKDGE